MTKEEFIEKYGYNKPRDNIISILEIPETIMSIDSRIVSGVTVVIFYEYRWFEYCGGLEINSIVGIYRNGKSDYESFTYRDRYYAGLDDYSLIFKKINNVRVMKDKVKVIVSSGSGKKTTIIFKEKKENLKFSFKN